MITDAPIVVRAAVAIVVVGIVAALLTVTDADLTVAAIVLLTFYGWLAARAAQLRSWQLFFATSTAAVLGLVMIALKDLVLVHLH